MAILLAGRTLDVRAITTVHGNAPVTHTTENARKAVELLGLTRIPIARGAAAPLTRAARHAPEVHGITGLDGPELPAPTVPILEADGPDTIIAVSREVPGLHLVPIGPLTNVALALARDPSLRERISRISLMGGSLTWGNITPAAEFNIYVDPQAADIVFKSGIPIVMMPLDVTHRVLTHKARVEKIKAIGSPAAVAMAEMLEFFERFDIEKYGSDGGPLHDPTVIAYLLRPDLFKGRDCNVEIETQSELTMGMTVVDWWRVTGRNPNARVMREVDADGFFDLLTERLARL